jgi:hypothetical protein
LVRLGAFEQTVRLPITSDSAVFPGSRGWTRYVVRADRAVHLRRTYVESEEATQDDFLLVAGEYADIELPEDVFLSVTLSDAETDGSLYITRTT